MPTRAQRNRSNTDSPDLDEAVAEKQKAVGLYERLVGEGRDDLATHLPDVYATLGSIYRSQGQWEEAKAADENSAPLFDRLVAQGQSELCARAAELDQAFVSSAT